MRYSLGSLIIALIYVFPRDYTMVGQRDWEERRGDGCGVECR